MTDTTMRPSRRREQTRARLMDAAHELFGEIGMDAASVEMISERAGFTRGAFYSNFDSKEELLLALMTQLSDAKMDEVAVRVRDLDLGALDDMSPLVDRVVDASFGEHMDPRLITEMRTQALRDARLAAAYLEWQGTMRGRVAAIVSDVAERAGVALRLPFDEAAQMLIDLSEDVCVRATLEGATPREVSARLNARLSQVVGLLVERP